MATWQFPTVFSGWVESLGQELDKRLRPTLNEICLGVLFAHGRRTVSSWLRAVGVGPGFEDYYYFLGSLGRKCEWVAGRVLRIIQKHLPLPERLLFGLDDTPTKRYGPKVEGAGIHHNPTPGPADQKFLYGHVWVTLAWLFRHPRWGTVALPLLARLYVRAKNVWLLRFLYGWEFRTKLELAAELVEWLARWLNYLGKTLWVVADGAYAKRPFLERAAKARVTVVSRLRKDAALWSVPEPPTPGNRRRGRPRIYGSERIDLAKRAGQSRAWQTDEFLLYGKSVTTRYKTFLATYRPAGGLVRVVLARNDNGTWAAFFCTDPQASVAEILEAIADRAAIEQVFHDVKEVHGAGQQQVRNVWANLAAWHAILWMHTLVEVWAWEQPQSRLCDRSDSPWDDPRRRPSHADRCKALRRACLEDEFRRCGTRRIDVQKILALAQRLAKRAA